MSREIKQRDSKGRFVKGHTLQSGENNSQWRGDGAGYFSVHDWVKLRLGKPNECENCGTKEAKKYEWANISGEYLRDLSDWARLCVSCHRLIDGHSYTRWATIRGEQNA